MASEDSGTGGIQPKGIVDVFQGDSAGSYFIWVRDVGAEPPHGTGPRKLPAQVRQANNGDSAEAMGGQKLRLPTAGYSDGGGGF